MGRADPSHRHPSTRVGEYSVHAGRAAADASPAVRQDRGARDLVGWILAASTAALLFCLSARRWFDIKAGASDLGIFDQAVWQLSRGHAPFVTTIGIDVFADHVSPVLLAFAPLYRIAATPLWLVAVQAACLGITVIPARRLADELSVGRGWATVLVVANPFIWNAAIYDVHPIVFATPAVAWLLLAIHRDDTRTATIAALVIVACRADAATILLGTALLAGPTIRRRLIWIAVPSLIASQVVPHLLGTWQTFERYYGHLGTTPIDAATHPWRLITLAPTAALQLALWLLPVGFLPLRRIRWVAALTVAGAPLLLSSWPGIVEPWWHHGAVLVPIVIAGTLTAMSPTAAPDGRRPTHRFDRTRILAGTSAALLSISVAAPWAPTEIRLPDILRPASNQTRAAVSAVDPDDVVSTTNDVAAQLAHRDDVYLWPCPFRDPPGPRRCSHPNLFTRASTVDIVVLPGTRDLSTLPGRWAITHRDGITIARRTV